MINKITRDKIEKLLEQYKCASEGNERALYEIAVAEIPEMVYNSNAIENSTLTLKETEEIILHDQMLRDHEIREVFEAKNLAKVTRELLKNPRERTSNNRIPIKRKSPGALDPHRPGCIVNNDFRLITIVAAYTRFAIAASPIKPYLSGRKAQNYLLI